MGDIAQIISTVGFPIGMCLLLAWYIKGEQDTMRSALSELKDAIRALTEEIKDMEREQRYYNEKKEEEKHDISRV